MVFINMLARDQLSLQVTDITSRTLVRQKVTAEKGDNIFTLDISRLNNGVYYVQVLPYGLQTLKGSPMHRGAF